MKAGLINMKKWISAVFVLLLIGGMASGALAAGPSLNQLPGDLELFTGRNVTKNQIQTADPVTADVGDTVEGVVYYHNGAEGTTAENFHIAINFNQTEVATSHVLAARLTADNITAPVTDTVVNGQVVGKSGLTVTLSQAAALEFIPGSVIWLPDGATTGKVLPHRQTGAELFTSTGLNLDQLQACWAHSGYLTFKMKSKVAGVPTIVKSKKAVNDTQHVDATTVVAKAGDHITYTLTTENSGTADQSNYGIEDGVRDILDYADVVSISDNGQAVDQTSTNRDDQTLVRYPSVTIKAGETVTRSFSVVVKNPIPTTPANGHAFDFVMFNNYGNPVVVTIEHPAVPFITITKLVRNVTKNEGVFSNADTAIPGDMLEYQIKVKNIGNKTVDAVLKDVVPNGVTPDAGSVAVSVSGASLPTVGDLFGSGLVLPKLAQTTEVTVVFRATASDKLADGTNLVNKAMVAFENQIKEASASTVIIVPPVLASVVTQAPPPATASVPALPKTGANPFAIMITVAGTLYTALARRKVSADYTRLSDLIEII